ncbi:MAG: MFS transporter [Acetobacteraceae bacterium]
MTENRKSAGHAMVLLTMCLAVLVAQVDTSVVNLAVRPIGADLGAGVAGLQWVLDAYNLTYAVLLLSGGLLADLYGRRLVFMIGLAVFAAASLLCAAAPGIGILIGARALTGVGAALLVPASLAIIRVVWTDPVERGRALGIWASCNGVAFAIGAPLGGILIAHLGWRSVFACVVPFAVAALVLAARAVPESADPHGRRFDLGGQGTGALALGALALAAIEAQARPWMSGTALAVCVTAFLAFRAVERRAGGAALVPFDLLRLPTFRGTMIATGAMTFGMYGVMFLVPLIWQESGTLGPQGTGFALLPMELIFIAVSPRSGRLTERFGARTLTAGGLAAMGGGLLVLAATHGGTNLPIAEVGLALAGLGMGLATGPLFAVAVAAVPSARSGTASALINVARMVGATIGVAALGSTFALLHGGADGLRAAMLAGGLVQLAGAATAWAIVR